VSEHTAATPGWFGKMPFLGDFASRRLPQAFIAPWDEWVQHSIAASRAQLGEQWLDIYLHSPIWRFALWPGVIGDTSGGDTGWAGVMMPSVDKVGRYFPLTIAAEIAPENFVAIFSEQTWFAAIESIALATLDMDFSIEGLEQKLTTTPAPRHARSTDLTTGSRPTQRAGSIDELPQPVALPSPNSLAALINSAAPPYEARSFWWGDTEPCALYCFRGLPPKERYAELLSGTVITNLIPD
jgi:type VI secretion system protein ImpM